jgi:2-polyprenyl-6-hydroxyphenyl methylase/3-demethylubiquinone-9 3-methyltransferase
MTKYVQFRWQDQPERAQIFDRVHDDLIRILAPRKHEPILEVGCGNGDMANHLIEEGYDVHGIDPAMDGIAFAKKKNADRFFLFDATDGFEQLPAALQHQRFPTIFSLEVIEHVYDPRAFVRFCRDVLRHAGGGLLILTTPYYGYFKNMLIGLAGGWDRHHNPLWDCGHIKFWSPTTLSALLKESGFEIREIKGLGRRIPYLWKHIFVVAEWTPPSGPAAAGA